MLLPLPEIIVFDEMFETDVQLLFNNTVLTSCSVVYWLADIVSCAVVKRGTAVSSNANSDFFIIR